MGKVAEFENELKKRTKSRFGSWNRVDLHNHSPASDDYKDKDPNVARRISQQIKDANLAVVMFTDHGKLPDAAFASQLSDQCGRLILRGVELNVFVDAFDKSEGKVSKNLFFHLLIGFDPECPSSPDYWLDHIYRKCKKETRQSGEQTLVGISASLEQLGEVLRTANAIIIPAHLHSTPNAFKSRSIDDIYADPEFLKYAKSYFTAIEVTSAKTAAFFDGAHVETEKLSKSCIWSSDSHEPDRLGWRCSYVQMERPTYAELKIGLELPFRTSLERPVEPSSYLIGIHVQGEFFPDLWLHFSPHCNFLIGVKGSGKTSVLECLRFVLGTEIPASKLESVRTHLQAILGAAGKVTALVKRGDGARILIERTVSNLGFLLTFEDNRQESLATPEGLQFPSNILGGHEIEQIATDPNIRSVYMDAIAGRQQIRKLEDEAKSLGREIRDKHSQTANRYGVYRTLHERVERLRELRKGLHELTQANLVQLRNEYQAAIEHRDLLEQMLTKVEELRGRAKEHLSGFSAGIKNRFAQSGSPIADTVAEVQTILDGIVEYTEDSGRTLEHKLEEAMLKLRDQVKKGNLQFLAFVDEYKGRTDQLSPEQRRLLETHREVLEQTRELSRLETDLSEAQRDTRDLLRSLEELCEKLANVLDQRTALRERRIQSFSSILEPSYGVRLSIIRQQHSTEFQERSSQYAQGAKALIELRSKLPERLVHLCLKKAYGELRHMLTPEYGRLLFDYGEFGFLLDVFENDDLRIELKVGKAGEEYSPIDRLSAGQRCTAIFPILLKMEEGVLIVDQPEDNLDNRHIATTISPGLLKEKTSRQMLFTSHNANLVVLSDAEMIAAFESDGSKGRLEEQGFFATRESPISKYVLQILDGGEYALQQRILKYGIRAST